MFTINLHSRTGTGPKKIRDRSGPAVDRPGPEPITGPVRTLQSSRLHSTRRFICMFHTTILSLTAPTKLSYRLSPGIG